MRFAEEIIINLNKATTLCKVAELLKTQYSVTAVECAAEQ